MTVRILRRTSYVMRFADRTYNVEFDEGYFKWNLAAAEDEIEANMAILMDTHPPFRMEDNKIRWIFQLCWTRLKNVIFPSILCFVLDRMS